MSTPLAQCPHCFARTPAGTGGVVKCPSCEGEFTPTSSEPPKKPAGLPVARAVPVGGKPAPVAKPTAAPVAKATAAPVPATKPKRDQDRDRDGDDDRPRSRTRGATAAGRRPAQDDDDRPRSRRQYEEDDDEPKKKKGGSALPVVLIGGGALLLLLLAGAGVVAVIVSGNRPVAQATMPSVATAPDAEVKGKNPPPRGNWNDPDPFLEPKVEEPKNPFGPGDFPGGPGPRPGEFPGGPGPRPGEPVKPKVPKDPPKFAAVTPLEIKPAKLADDKTEVKLPGKVADTCAGGGGRFFLLHLSDKRQLAVFDVNEGKVVKYLPLASDKVKFAAGMNKLVLAYPDQDTLVRYDLTTFEKEATAKNPLGGTVRHLCMGSASAGPLLIGCTQGNGQLDAAPVAFLDPTTFKEVDIQHPQNRLFQGNVRDAMHFRASPDGTVFAGWCTSHSPQGLNSSVLTGGEAKGYYEHDSVGHLVPGPDNQLYTGAGLYTNQLKKLGRADRTRTPLLPAAEGAMHLRLASGNEQAPFPGGMPGDGQKMKLEVRMSGEERTVHTFKDVSLVGNEAWTSNDFTNDKRVHFAPTAHLLAVVSPANDSVVVHKFDLEAAFEASGVDYLYVTSRPTTATPGKLFAYQILARSKKGGVKYKLEAGPKGMAVSPAGLVTWPAPADFAAAEPVLVTVSDGSGQEIFHAFDLTPGDGKGFAPPPTGTVVRGGDTPDAKAGGPLVPAPERVFEVTPPAVQEKATVALPGAADAVCVGGGGRFLIYRLGTKKQLAVLDVTAGRVVKYLPLAEGDALFAAGMTKLFVLNKAANALVRYDLEKFEKELTAQNPLGGSPSVMLMGHSSDGPLYIGGPDVGTDTKGYGFVNPRTMKELKVPLEGKQDPGGVPGGVPTGPAVGGDRFRGGGGAVGVAISPDGRTLTWADDWGGNKVMTLGDKSAKVKGDGIGGGQNRGALVPGPDGSLFGSTGLYSAELKRLDDAKSNPGFSASVYAPATSGPWYVKLTGGDRFNPDAGKRKVQVGLTSDERIKFPLDSLDGLPATNPEPWAQPGQQAAKVPLPSRLHLVPAAEILAVLDDGMEKVHLHRVPVKALLDKSDGDTMLVVSRPRPAVRGQKWAYTPEVWTKKGPAKVKVESGPDGMKADGGAVTWDVPAKFADDEPTVILTVSDRGGQETFHTFALSVRNEPLPAAAVIKPTPPVVDPLKAVDPTLPKPKAVAFPLKPTAAKDGTDIDLPAAADAACLAGGGRFILFRIPSKKLVAVFDVVDGKLVKELALPEDAALVAGSRTFAFVVNPKAGLVQRWNLTTFEKEASTKLPDGFSPTMAVMGHSSEGPMFLAGGNERFDPKSPNGFYDPLTLKKIELRKAADAMVVGDVKPGPSPAEAGSVFCSPDGRVWAWWNRGSSPTGLRSLVIEGESARGASSHVSVGPIVVGPDGSLFTGAGVFAGDQSKVIEATVKGVKVQAVNSWREINIDNGGYYQPLARTPIPAADGPFYLWYPAEKYTPGTPRPIPKPTDPPPPEVPPTLKLVGVSDPLGEVKGLRGMSELKEDPTRPRVQPGHPQAEKPFLAHQRTFLIPGAELLAVLSPDGTKVHIHAFKARELIDKSGQEYLLVMGRPPQFATPGQKWTYTPDVWSKKGGVKVEVVSGPAGLKAVGAGFEWDVPKDLLDNRVTAEVRVTDASGRKVTERFALSLDGSAPTPPTQTSEGGSPGKADPPKKEGPKADDPNGGGKKIVKGQIDNALVGTWVVSAVQYGNSGITTKLGPSETDTRFEFRKDGTTHAGTVAKAHLAPGTFTTDPTGNPKALDLVSAQGGGKFTFLMVYEVNGDVLTICKGEESDSPRPTELTIQKGVRLVTLTRVKDGPKPAERIGKQGKVDDALVGKWHLGAVRNGSATSALFPHSTTQVEFRKDGTTTAGTTAKAHLPPGTFVTDPTAKPKALDLTVTQGGKEVTFPAVYDVAGDFLNIYRAESPDGPRPTQLGEGKGVLAFTLSRVKDDPKQIVQGKFDDALVGSWLVTKLEVNGGELPSNVSKQTYTFGKDGSGRLTGGPQDAQLKYTVDGTTSPKTIDLTSTATGLPDSEQRGVYEVSGDTLRLCTALGKGAERPKAVKGGDKILLLTLTRVKDGPKPPVAQPPKEAKKVEKAKPDDALTGTWVVDKAEMNGKEMPIPPPIAAMRHIFDKDGGVRVTGGPSGDELVGIYAADPSASPKTIDMTLKSARVPEVTHRGVYAVEDNTLRLAMPPVPGGARPTDLKGTPQSPVMVLRRLAEKKEEPKK